MMEVQSRSTAVVSAHGTLTAFVGYCLDFETLALVPLSLSVARPTIGMELAVLVLVERVRGEHVPTCPLALFGAVWGLSVDLFGVVSTSG